MRMLYLDLDTLRPDHLGCYGYHRNTSPNIDRIASEGVRFDNYHCPDAPCLPSRTSMMTGQFGIRHGAVGHGGTAADVRLEGHERDFRTALGLGASLPGMLKNAGYKTVTVSPFAERHTTWSFYAGFDEMYNTGKGGLESAEEVSPTAMDWIDRCASDDNWFLHVNYWDPHTPYRAPEGFGNPFADQPLPDWISPEIIEQHNQLAGPHSARDLMMYHGKPDPNFPRHPGQVRNMEEFRDMIDGYDCGIAYMDQHIGRILDALEKKGVLEDTAIIVSSDHGENLGELGIYAEHGTADEITTRIPMIVRWPGGKQGIADEGFHYNLDLGPTLAELVDGEKHGTWDGESYAPTILSGEEKGREYLVVSQCAHVCQRAVRFEGYIYIRTYHDGFHSHFPREMLFNLAEDPHEQNNLAEQNPELCGKALRYLNEWYDEMMQKNAKNGYENDPLWTVVKEGGPFHARNQLLQYCETQLKGTDREDAIEEYKRRHPEKFPQND